MNTVCTLYHTYVGYGNSSSRRDGGESAGIGRTNRSTHRAYSTVQESNMVLSASAAAKMAATAYTHTPGIYIILSLTLALKEREIDCERARGTEKERERERELSVYRLVSLIIFQFNFIEQTQSKRFYLCSLFIPYGYFVAAGFYQNSLDLSNIIVSLCMCVCVRDRAGSGTGALLLLLLVAMMVVPVLVLLMISIQWL